MRSFGEDFARKTGYGEYGLYDDYGFFRYDEAMLTMNFFATISSLRYEFLLSFYGCMGEDMASMASKRTVWKRIEVRSRTIQVYSGLS